MSDPGVDPQTQERVHRLWDELSDYSAGQLLDATNGLLTCLAGELDAVTATWGGAVRISSDETGDPLGGWRVGAMMALDAEQRPQDLDRFRAILRHWDRRAIDPSFLLPLRGAGNFRSYGLRADLPPEWFDGAFYRTHYAPAGIVDAVFVAFPLNDDAESHFALYAAHPFTPQQVALFRYALRGIKWFHRHLMLAHGVTLANGPLSPAERRILQMLLTDRPEKQIAHDTDLTVPTVHQYVVSIYRKFGVRSRAGLMSLWLNGHAKSES